MRNRFRWFASARLWWNQYGYLSFWRQGSKETCLGYERLDFSYWCEGLVKQKYVRDIWPWATFYGENLAQTLSKTRLNPFEILRNATRILQELSSNSDRFSFEFRSSHVCVSLKWQSHPAWIAHDPWSGFAFTWIEPCSNSVQAWMGLARILNKSRLKPNRISSESDRIPSEPDRILIGFRPSPIVSRWNRARKLTELSSSFDWDMYESWLDSAWTMIRAFLSLVKICMNLYESLQSAHVFPYRAEIVQRVICWKLHLLHGIHKRRARPKTGATTNPQRVQKRPRMWQKYRYSPSRWDNLASLGFISPGQNVDWKSA